MLGGCSAHNACVMLAGIPADYDEWGAGWSYAEFEPYLRRGARELRVEGLANDELSPWHRAFAEAAGPDTIVHDVNAVGSVALECSVRVPRPGPGTAEPRDRGRYARRSDRARRLPHRPGHAQGGDGAAGGAYGSPGILLRSGIGPGLAHDLPVGEGLVDHVGVGLSWVASAELHRDVASFKQPLFMGQVTVRRNDLFFFPAIEQDDAISGAVFFMKPFSRGRVRLNGPDPRTPLAIEHGFLSDDRDVEPLVEDLEGLRELAASEPVRRYAVRELRPAPRFARETHVRRRRGASTPGRDVRDRLCRRRSRAGARPREGRRRRRLDHADDPPCQHEPDNDRDRRTDRRIGLGEALAPGIEGGITRAA